MPTPITTQTVSFTYNIADKLYATTSAQNKTATGNYTGPDRVWVFINTDTGLLNQSFAPLTSREDGADVPVPIGTTKVEVTATDNPVIISMLKEDCVTYTDVSTTDDTLPDGFVFTYNSVATLSQTYDLANLMYNTDTNTWSTGDFVTSPMTWDFVLSTRNSMLTASDGKISPDMPDVVKQPWINYRQALRDLPNTFGYGTDSEIEAWKVNYPHAPE
jgi:hypothetical protein